jgi:hypothetical protein
MAFLEVGGTPMPEANEPSLHQYLEPRPEPRDKIVELRVTSDARYLGSVGIAHHLPLYHHGLSGELSGDSRFILIPCAYRPAEPVLCVLFRQFDASTYQPFPEDLVAGWMPIAEESQARAWVDELNLHIQWLLEQERSPKPGRGCSSGPWLSVRPELTPGASHDERDAAVVNSGAPAFGRLCGYCLSDRTLRVACEVVASGAIRSEWRCTQCGWFTLVYA